MASKKKLKKQIAMLKEGNQNVHKILVMDLYKEKRQCAYWRNKYFDLLDNVEFNDGTKQSEANQ